jgi:hypothetical protein
LQQLVGEYADPPSLASLAQQSGLNTLVKPLTARATGVEAAVTSRLPSSEARMPLALRSRLGGARSDKELGALRGAWIRSAKC